LAISIRFWIGLLVSSWRSTRLGLVAHDATVALPAPTGHPTGFVESRPPVSEKKPRAGLPKTHGAGGALGAGSLGAASDPTASSIFQSVQQLGLKLQAGKAPVDTIVIDHLEKTPTEN
jgi:hypothetical protein